MYTIGQFLIVWFSDYIWDKSGHIMNTIIAMVNPVIMNMYNVHACIRLYMYMLYVYEHTLYMDM